MKRTDGSARNRRKTPSGSIVLGMAIALVVAACATSPLGRTQLVLFSDAQLSQMGAAAFDKQKQETPTTRSSTTRRYVECISNHITDAITGTYAGRSWEVVVFESEAVNAFALPGGKIGVYTGLLKVAGEGSLKFQFLLRHQPSGSVPFECPSILCNRPGHG